MKKKMYRIELKEKSGIAQDIAVFACLSNGGKYMPLTDMVKIAEVELLKYPSLNTDISINPIGENNLTIDRGTDNLLAITEIEVMELVDEYCPTIARYLQPQGLADNSNHEALN